MMTNNVNTAAAKRVKEDVVIIEELRIKRSQLTVRHAKEIGELDNAINQAFSRLSAAASMITL